MREVLYHLRGRRGALRDKRGVTSVVWGRFPREKREGRTIETQAAVQSSEQVGLSARLRGWQMWICFRWRSELSNRNSRLVTRDGGAAARLPADW